MTGSCKGHSNHKIMSKELEHYLGSGKVTGPPKRSLLLDERRLGDCNINMLLSGT